MTLKRTAALLMLMALSSLSIAAGTSFAEGKVRIDEDGTFRVGGSEDTSNFTVYEDGSISNIVGETERSIDNDKVSTWVGDDNNHSGVTQEKDNVLTQVRNGNEYSAVTQTGGHIYTKIRHEVDDSIISGAYQSLSSSAVSAGVYDSTGETRQGLSSSGISMYTTGHISQIVMNENFASEMTSLPYSTTTMAMRKEGEDVVIASQIIRTTANDVGVLTTVRKGPRGGESLEEFPLTASTNLTDGAFDAYGANRVSLQAGSTSMTLNNNGIAFSRGNGEPTKLTGVADGTNDYDAVNYRQMKKAYRGVASVAAMANIPDCQESGKFALGAGYGYYAGQSALALGVSGRVDAFALKTSVGLTSGGHTSVGAGVSYQFGGKSSYNALSASELNQKVVALTDTNRAVEAQLKAALSREEAAEQRHKTELASTEKEIQAMRERTARLEKQLIRMSKTLEFLQQKVK